MRVVSLLPSATELVCALGVDPVGVSHECDFPPRVRDLPTVVHSRIDTSGSSDDIDAQVQTVSEGEGVYQLDRERLREVDPDVVVTQGLCDVCAVDEAVVRDTIASLGLDAELVATHPHTLDDVFEDIDRIGRAIGRETAAERLVSDLRARVASVEARAADAPTPTVTVLDWLDPVMVSGHWVPELVELAGGEFLLAEPGERSGPVEWDTVRDADPDVLVAAPCGFSTAKTMQSLGDLTDRPGWRDLTAVRTGRTHVLDGNHYVNRPGPRLVETLETLAAVIHPDRFEPPNLDLLRRMPRPGERPS